MSKGQKHQKAEKPQGTVLHKRVTPIISRMYLIATAHEQVKAYNGLTSIMREILKEIHTSHDNKKLSCKDILMTIEIEDTSHEVYRIYEEPGYYIVWSPCIVAELQNDTFTRHIEFNNISSIESFEDLQPHNSQDHLIDFFTLTDIVNSVLDIKSESLGLQENDVARWKKDAQNALDLAELLKRAAI